MKAQGITFIPTSSWTGHLNSGALVSLSVIETIRACMSPPSWCPCSGENLEKGVCSEKNCVRQPWFSISRGHPDGQKS